MTDASTRPLRLPETRLRWWIPLVIGIAWLMFAMAVLQFDMTSAWAIAVAAGLLLIVASFTELVNALAAPGWRWMHVALAVIFFAGGIIMLVWPAPTFLALARLVAWFLFFKGCADLVLALGRRGEDTLWWLRLLIGPVEIAIAFWAASYPGRSALLLTLWIGLTAIAKGVTDIVLAFEIRSWRRTLAAPVPSQVPGAAPPDARPPQPRPAE